MKAFFEISGSQSQAGKNKSHHLLSKGACHDGITSS